MSQKLLMIVNATLNLNEKEAFTHYSEHSAPLFKKAGGIPVSKHKILETLIGGHELSVVSVMEFPEKQVILNVFESEEYKELLTFRDKAFSKLEVFIGSN